MGHLHRVPLESVISGEWCARRVYFVRQFDVWIVLRPSPSAVQSWASLVAWLAYSRRVHDVKCYRHHAPGEWKFPSAKCKSRFNPIFHRPLA
eukprot:3410983-Prymnesium_polylepis.2